MIDEERPDMTNGAFVAVVCMVLAAIAAAAWLVLRGPRPG
jgi:hypothetical protein